MAAMLRMGQMEKLRLAAAHISEAALLMAWGRPIPPKRGLAEQAAQPPSANCR